MPRNRYCGSYGPGHLMHWIQAKKSHEDGQPIHKVRIVAVHDVSVSAINLTRRCWRTPADSCPAPRSRRALIASGVNAEGYAEMLGVQVSSAEDGGPGNDAKPTTRPNLMSVTPKSARINRIEKVGQQRECMGVSLAVTVERSVADMSGTRINAKNRYIAQVREKRRIDKTPAESADSIKDYVDHVADIAIRPDKAGGNPDFDTPLVDNTLPADIDPETAAEMASNLRAALPRIRELLGLLTRRGNREDD